MHISWRRSFIIVRMTGRDDCTVTPNIIHQTMIIDKQILDRLTAQAKASPRLRMNLDLRTSPGDLSQRMLNAIEPGTVLPVHRHRTTSETVVCVRGHFEEYFYDGEGRLTETIDMYPGGPVINIPVGQWHSLKSLESGTVLLECKDGAYEPLGEEDIQQSSI